MFVKRRRGWELPDSATTPEATYLDRRKLLATMGFGAAATMLPAAGHAAPFPAPRNDRYRLDRPQTAENLATTYNNFFEFGSQKAIWREARALKTRPWTIAIKGMVERPFEIGVDELFAKMPVEERLYRHRCVETWAMAVPYTGFALSALLELAKPLGAAKYVVMQSPHDAKIFPGQREFYYPWPYTEGLTMAEAANELAFVATGLYGKPIPAQNGAPLRLALPWKYGFKHVKSIVSIAFTDQRPVSFWQKLAPDEYGFWANVNPAVPHPRWSQATEKMLGSEERIPTLPWNGYGDFVAHLYKDMAGEKLFM